MSTDPLVTLLPAFGDVLARHRRERKWTADALATASGLPAGRVLGFERGDCGPSFNDFVRIARGLGQQPAVLLVEVIAEWRAGPFDTRYTSRASDFARLFRLGYDHRPGDFRELPAAYHSVAEATHAAARLNARRLARGVALLDTVCTYVRLDYVSLQADAKEVAP